MLSEKIKEIIGLLKQADEENRKFVASNSTHTNLHDSIARSCWKFFDGGPDGRDILFIGNYFGGGDIERNILEIEGALVIIEDTRSGYNYATAYGDVIDEIEGAYE